jgi:hypothetical protein
MSEKKILDAEVLAEEKHAVEEKVERITVIEKAGDDSFSPQGEDSNEVCVRVQTRSRHRLNVEVFEIDDDGCIDIIISDADTN